MSKLHYQESPSQKERDVFAKYLAEDEELILATGLGKAYLRSRFIVGLAWPGAVFLILALGVAYFLKFDLRYAALIGLFAAGAVAYLKTVLTYHANRYLLTNGRVIIKRGVFAVQLTSALYDKITHLEVDQSFFDKIFMHHGTIIVNTAGLNKGEIVLKYVDYPMEFKNLLERLINRERERFGLRAGSIETIEGEIV